MFTVGLDARKLFLGLGPVEFPTRPEIASANLMPNSKLTPQSDYVVAIVGGRKELFGKDDADLRKLGSGDLQKLALELMSDWSLQAKSILAEGEAFFFVEMFSSSPIEIPPHPNVTLLGDAIHAMTPTLGRGANVAMRDGSFLARHLCDVAKGKKKLPRALSAYEKDMAIYGFSVVKESALLGARLIGQNPLPSSFESSCVPIERNK